MVTRFKKISHYGSFEMNKEGRTLSRTEKQPETNLNIYYVFSVAMPNCKDQLRINPEKIKKAYNPSNRTIKRSLDKLPCLI